MTSEDSNIPLSIVGDLDVGEPNTEINLYTGPLRISKDGEVLEKDGTIEFSWFPHPGLQFSVHNDDYLGVSFSILEGKFALELLEMGIHLEAFGTSHTSNSLTGNIVGEVESGTGEGIEYVTFYIPNFVDFIGEPIRDDGKNNWRADRLSLDIENWQILIDKLPDKKTTYEVLKNQGGYAVTHIGRMQKKNGQTLTPAEIHRMRKKLFEFLAFCKGTFCGPILLTGYDSKGVIVWRDWSDFRVQSWRDQNSWLPVYKVGQTKQVLAAFLSISIDERWEEALSLAIH